MKPISPESGSRSKSLVELSAALVAAYVCRNAVAAADLSMTIRCVHASLVALQAETRTRPTRAFRCSSDIAASIGHDYLISFIDGKAYKSLKRHLTAHGMTPSEYRGRYGLPNNYPLVSPGYAASRSLIAKQAHRRFRVD